MSKLSVSERLKEARKRAGFSSAKSAAEAFGWNENTYKSHENGIRGFGTDLADRYSKAFRVDFDWLLRGEEAKRRRTTKMSGVEGIVSSDPNLFVMGVIEAGGRVTTSSEKTAADVPPYLEIRGDYIITVVGAHRDLWPLEPGWQLFFVPASIEECVDELCLVVTAKGETFVKRLKRGSDGLYNLEHFNPMIQTIENVEVTEAYRFEAMVRTPARS